MGLCMVLGVDAHLKEVFRVKGFRGLGFRGLGL